MKTTAPLATAESRIYSLDLLRAIAIIAVLLFHFPHRESAIVFRAISHYGLWGVDLFFVLSGYLIGGQWFRNLDFKSFYLRRFIRTLPAYYAFLIAAVAFGFYFEMPLPGWHFWIFVQNFHPMDFLTHTWSLCVEEHFYLLFPFLGLLIWQRPKSAKLIFSILLITPLILRTAIWFWLRPDLTAAIDIHKTYSDYHTYIYFPSLMRFDTLVIGVAIAFMQIKNPNLWARLLGKSHKLFAISMVLLGTAAATGLSRFSFVSCTILFNLVGLGFGALLISCLGRDAILTKIKLPLVQTIAIMSYSIYLTHLMAMGLSEKLGSNLGLEPYSLAQVLLHILSIASLGWILYTAIEKPFLHLRDRFLKKTPTVLDLKKW